MTAWQEAVVLTEHERLIAEHIVEPGDIRVTFDSIGGLAEHKTEIMDTVREEPVAVVSVCN